MAGKGRTSKKRGGRKGAPRSRKIILAALSLLFAVLGVSGVGYYYAPFAGVLESGVEQLENLPAKVSKASANPAAGEAYSIVLVKRVVDGDTLVVEAGSKEDRVRLICVDTPESVHPDPRKNSPLGKQAYEYTRGRLENRQVRLANDGKDTFDRYGRRLAYVMVDGANFNVELVREGYSEYYVKYGKSQRFDPDFRRAESDARESRRGLWSPGAADLLPPAPEVAIKD